MKQHPKPIIGEPTHGVVVPGYDWAGSITLMKQCDLAKIITRHKNFVSLVQLTFVIYHVHYAVAIQNKKHVVTWLILVDDADFWRREHDAHFFI